MDTTPQTPSLLRTVARLAMTATLALAAVLPAAAQDLAPGGFEWTPEAAPAGPVVIVVSLPEQRAHVYRNGIRTGVATISSGKPGNETPTGVFPILQKSRDHRSNLYNNAPMPFMQRLTWDGIALHAGRIPGYPASHGCVRLPKAFAEQLFRGHRERCGRGGRRRQLARSPGGVAGRAGTGGRLHRYRALRPARNRDRVHRRRPAGLDRLERDGVARNAM